MFNWLVASAKVPYGYNWTVSPWLFVQCTQSPFANISSLNFYLLKYLRQCKSLLFYSHNYFPSTILQEMSKEEKFSCLMPHKTIAELAVFFSLSRHKLANTLLWKILFSSSHFSPSAVGTSPKVCTEATVERLPQHKVITKETLMGTKIRYRRLWFYGVILARFCFNILLFFLLTFSPNRFDSGCRRDTLNGADDFFPSRKINDF